MTRTDQKWNSMDNDYCAYPPRIRNLPKCVSKGLGVAERQVRIYTLWVNFTHFGQEGLNYKTMILWGTDLLLGNARNTHAANNTGVVFSVIRAANIAMQRAIHAANNRERLFSVFSLPSGYKVRGRSVESVWLEAPACQDMRLGAEESATGLLSAGQFSCR
jgi:hypothetical protein